MSELGDEKAILEEQFRVACDRAEEWKAKYNSATARADSLATEARLTKDEHARMCREWKRTGIELHDLSQKLRLTAAWMESAHEMPNRGDAHSVRTLMAAFRMDRRPDPAGTSEVLTVWRCGPLYYAWHEDAGKLWDWLPSGTFHHEMTMQRHVIVFHADTLVTVAAICLDHGTKLLVR